MTFEIPFNSRITTEQHELILKLTFRNHLKRNTYSFLLSVLIMLLVFPTVRDGDVTGYFFLGAGSILFINSLRYFWFYRKRAAKFRQEYKEMIDVREKNKNVSTWEFADDHFGYKDMHFEFRIKWEAFKGYQIVERNLFLQLTSSIGQSFIITEREIGTNEYKSVLELVRRKIKYVTE